MAKTKTRGKPYSALITLPQQPDQPLEVRCDVHAQDMERDQVRFRWRCPVEGCVVMITDEYIARVLHPEWGS